MNRDYIRLLGKIFATGMMSFCGVVSETSMNVTFPALMNEFGIDTSLVQWVTTGYLLVLSLVITLSSYLKRNFTQRTLFLTAIGCFIVATVLCAWSANFAMLIGLLVVCIIAAFYLVRRSKDELSPLLRFEVFEHGKFVLGLFGILAVQFATLAIGYAIPNYSQLVNHTGAFLAGSLLVPGCILGAVLAVVGGTIYDKLGPKRPILFGFSCLSLSMILFSCFGHHLSTLQFYGFYMLYTLGQGLCVGNMLTYCLSTLPRDLAPDGNALINSLQQLSGAAGTAVAASFVAAAQAAYTDSLAIGTAQGSTDAFILLSVLLLLALAAAGRMFKEN